MKAEEYIKYITETLIPTGDLELTPGFHALENGSYYNVDMYLSKPESQCRYEAHKKYIDIQYLLEGQELIFVAETEGLNEIAPYSEERDIVFFAEPDSSRHYHLKKGDYLVLYPNDAHKPSVCVTKAEQVKKIVFKVKCDA